MAVVALCSLTCGTQTRFSLLPLYCKGNFSGRDLGSQGIVMTPLLTSQGVERHEQLTPEKEIEAVEKERRDLRLLRPVAFEDRYIKKFGPDSLESAYEKLFKGAVVDLQNAPSFWKEVASDYLMVLKLTYGLKIKSFDSRAVRQVRVEGLVGGDRIPSDAKAGAAARRPRRLGTRYHGQERRAVAFSAWTILLQGLVDGGLAAEVSVDGLDRQAVGLLAAVAASLADSLVDHDPLNRIGGTSGLACGGAQSRTPGRGRPVGWQGVGLDPGIISPMPAPGCCVALAAFEFDLRLPGVREGVPQPTRRDILPSLFGERFNEGFARLLSDRPAAGANPPAIAPAVRA